MLKSDSDNAVSGKKYWTAWKVLDCLEKFGEVRTGSGGITQIFFSRRSAKRAIKDLKKSISAIEHAGRITVMTDDCRVITGYRKK